MATPAESLTPQHQPQQAVNAIGSVSSGSSSSNCSSSSIGSLGSGAGMASLQDPPTVALFSQQLPEDTGAWQAEQPQQQQQQSYFYTMPSGYPGEQLPDKGALHHQLLLPPSQFPHAPQQPQQPQQPAARPAKPKRKRVASQAQRKAANVRERRRMFNLNEAFDLLRAKVPTFAFEKRLSRIETLRLAITYIRFMGQVISGVPPDQVRLRVPSECPQPHQLAMQPQPQQLPVQFQGHESAASGMQQVQPQMPQYLWDQPTSSSTIWDESQSPTAIP